MCPIKNPGDIIGKFICHDYPQFTIVIILISFCYYNKLLQVQWLKPGIPNPWATDWYWSMTYEEMGCTAGGEQGLREQSFICIGNHFPSLNFTTWSLLSVTSAMALDSHRSKNPLHLCNALESSRNHSTHHPSPWKNCLPWNQSLVPKKLGTTGLNNTNVLSYTEGGQRSEISLTGIQSRCQYSCILSTSFREEFTFLLLSVSRGCLQPVTRCLCPSLKP